MGLVPEAAEKGDAQDRRPADDPWVGRESFDSALFLNGREEQKRSESGACPHIRVVFQVIVERGQTLIHGGAGDGGPGGAVRTPVRLLEGTAQGILPDLRLEV